MTIICMHAGTGSQLTTDIQIPISKLICPKAYSTSGITFNCTFSGRELHWNFTLITDHRRCENWTSTIYYNNCNIRSRGSIPGLTITGHQPSCSASENIESEVTVIPDPDVVTSEILNVSCFANNRRTHERVYSREISMKFSSKLVTTPLELL